MKLNRVIFPGWTTLEYYVIVAGKLLQKYLPKCFLKASKPAQTVVILLPSTDLAPSQAKTVRWSLFKNEFTRGRRFFTMARMGHPFSAKTRIFSEWIMFLCRNVLLFRRNTNIFCGIVSLSRIHAYSLEKCVFVKTGVFFVETDAFSVQFKNNRGCQHWLGVQNC